MNKVRRKTRPLGSVRLEKYGRWYVARIPASVDPRRPPVKGRFKSVREAQRAIDKAVLGYPLNQSNSGLERRTDGEHGQTLASLCQTYIDARFNDKNNPIGINSRRAYERALRKLLKTCHIDKMSFTDITTTNLKTILIVLDRADKSFLSAVISYANETGKLDPPVFMPTTVLRRTKNGTARKQKSDIVHLPTYQELADLVSVDGLEYRFRVMLLVAAWCGLRQVECLSLTTSDILDAGINVNHVMIWDPKRQEFIRENTKAGTSNTVPVPTKLLSALKIVAEGAHNDILFYSKHHNYILSPVFDNSVYKWARLKAGISPNIKFKDLRSFCGSIVVDSGASVVEAAAYLRHTPQVSVDHYLTTTADPVRISLRKTLEGETVGNRVDCLFEMFLKEFPKVEKSLKILPE